MLLPPFDLLEPNSLKTALQALRAEGRIARPLAGGTDVIPDLKREYDRRLRFPSLPPFRPGPFPDLLVSLNRVRALHGIRFDKTAVRFGPLATMAQIAASPKVKRTFGALADGAASVGSPQVRNRATLGGNLCNARPCADTAPPCVALGAVLQIESADGRREVPAAEFFTGPGQTVLARGELVTGVVFQLPEATSGSAFFKLGARRAFEIAMVSSAAALALDGDRVRSARIVLGSCGPTPLLAVGAGEFLAGKEATDSAFREAAAVAASESRPIDDFRAKAGYRRRMTEVLVFRALDLAAGRARSSRGSR